ncbi:Uncharacterized protein TCM_019397 [Theobroma cacao]|uniref:Uncharacterized protein n=1 Tax=Theobroma cacao TaxID=3641 RepID=A0A061EH01_THECC|nr:Uncharacterized protein TCM_019397 [Theobroma cacao]
MHKYLQKRPMVAQVSLKRIGGQGRALHGVDMRDNSRLVKLRGPTVPYLLSCLLRWNFLGKLGGYIDYCP